MRRLYQTINIDDPVGHVADELVFFSKPIRRDAKRIIEIILYTKNGSGVIGNGTITYKTHSDIKVGDRMVFPSDMPTFLLFPHDENSKYSDVDVLLKPGMFIEGTIDKDTSLDMYILLVLEGDADE